jgi:drug/metabolite transporter (DMT)-like permease
MNASAPPHSSDYSRRHRVWLGLALAIALDTVTPLVWKAWTMRLPAGAGLPQHVLAAFAQPLFWLMVALFFAQYFNWMAVLATADVSYAQPITALSYVAVSLFSVLIMEERFTALRGAGIGLILVGVWLIGTTPVRTTGVGTADSVFHIPTGDGR